jgi:hypothetical protein
LGIRISLLSGFSERFHRSGVILAEDKLHSILKVSGKALSSQQYQRQSCYR